MEDVLQKDIVFDKGAMTKEQIKAYDEFIDYMVKLYHDFSYLLDESKEEKTESVI